MEPKQVVARKEHWNKFESKQCVNPTICKWWSPKKMFKEESGRW